MTLDKRIPRLSVRQRCVCWTPSFIFGDPVLSVIVSGKLRGTVLNLSAAIHTLFKQTLTKNLVHGGCFSSGEKAVFHLVKNQMLFKKQKHLVAQQENKNKC